MENADSSQYHGPGSMQKGLGFGVPGTLDRVVCVLSFELIDEWPRGSAR